MAPATTLDTCDQPVAREVSSDKALSEEDDITVVEDGYSYTYNNQDGYTSERLDPALPYQVSEHIMWAPRKIRVASIGAGAAGLMLCYKAEKEFGGTIDLVVYDREPCLALTPYSPAPSSLSSPKVYIVIESITT
ncbi:hypothetical protein BJY01DRAFT_567 [Aspergillus pseudoustus]|uniref:Uncharacterized protein n=1 Tax=Aspergillus pseudoustus TaxID=1810923 RepID=A0ABR4L1W7_9EURO